MAGQSTKRRLPVGAEVLPAGGVHFRVWADRHRNVEVVVEGAAGEHDAVVLDRERNGYFSGSVADAGPGTLYRYRLDGGQTFFPDPASRFQPEGPHGPSQVIDPTGFPWADAGWTGPGLEGQVLYEMHVGTFTTEGTWEAAAGELAEVARAGITVLELMPVADFAGRFGWGYDGVNLFAPTRLYGTPDDFRRFVDHAHAVGLGVILDVVYNHLGPSGNYLREFSARYFTDRYENDWGDALNFDGPGSGPVREFFIGNAGYWVDEFQVDGLRLDATSQIIDRSGSHVLAEISRRARGAARGRSIILIAENEPQEVEIVTPVENGGHGMDGVWNDDFLEPVPEPFLAPVRRTGWTVLWSSEDPRYGGTGTPPVETEEGWRVPAHSAVVLEPAGGSTA